MRINLPIFVILHVHAVLQWTLFWRIRGKKRTQRKRDYHHTARRWRWCPNHGTRTTWPGSRPCHTTYISQHPVCCRSWTSGMSSLGEYPGQYVGLHFVTPCMLQVLDFWHVKFSTQGDISVYTLSHPVCCRSLNSGMSSLGEYWGWYISLHFVTPCMLQVLEFWHVKFGWVRRAIYQSTLCHTLYAAGPRILARQVWVSTQFDMSVYSLPHPVCQVWASTQGDMSVHTLPHPVCCRPFNSGTSSLGEYGGRYISLHFVTPCMLQVLEFWHVKFGWVPSSICRSTLCHTLYVKFGRVPRAICQSTLCHTLYAAGPGILYL